MGQHVAKVFAELETKLRNAVIADLLCESIPWPKPKRGRPPKAKAEPPKKRGRPAKVNADAVATAEQTPAPKKRGRPKKAAPETVMRDAPPLTEEQIANATAIAS